MNAFLIFAKKERSKVHQNFPFLPTSMVSKILGCRWRGLGEEERRGYFLQQEELARQHRIQHPNFCYRPRRRNRIL